MPHIALVVDDSMLIRHAVCRFLEERGYEVESATNGVEALEILEKIQPEFIVTDLSMPRMTGQELIAELRLRPETSRIPVVVLAGRQSAATVAPPSEAQFVIYKDIEMEQQLERAVKALAGRTDIPRLRAV